jgi:hypothetical protein
MVDVVEAELSAAPVRGLGRSFRNIGWFGFWTQVVMAVAPILAFVVVFGAVRGFSLPGGRIGLLGWFSLLSVVLLLFTTWWSWRYRSIGRRLEQGAEPPDRAALIRTVWTGVTASALGIVLSLVVILAEVIYLLLVFLEAPQGGAPVFQTVEGSALSWITALDLLSLLALTLTASAEIVALLLALWLLYRLSSPGESSSAERAG